MVLDHHIQRSIVYKLALSQSLRFSELKPDDLDNKLFDYHLKKVVGSGLVEKNSSGLYGLTPEGRRLGVHVLEASQALIDRAYSVLFLVIKHEDTGKLLLYRRKNHPLYDRVGFMHVAPNALEPVTKTASKQTLDKTGLVADFNILGSGFFRIYDGEKLESFTNFTMLVCEDATGELKQNDDLAEYYWSDLQNIEASKNILPNMADLLKLYRTGKPFFIDRTIKI